MLDFFICGVQKGGTTVLDSFLREHPAVEMAKVKEVHFFDNEYLDWAAPDYRQLHAAFDSSAPARRRGEATPIYSYWPNALERLRAYNSSAKLILMLRHPVLRAWSHWRMETTRGWDMLPFSEAIRPTARERVRSAPGGVHRVFSYVERGFYAAQIERMLNLFPTDQVLILRTDALWRDPVATLTKTQDFLGLERLLGAQRRYVAPRYSGAIASDKNLPLRPEDADYLAALYSDDIRRTQSLTGLDLGDWLALAPPYEDTMRL